jgi:hypothetical protein
MIGLILQSAKSIHPIAKQSKEIALPIAFVDCGLFNSNDNDINLMLRIEFNRIESLVL